MERKYAKNLFIFINFGCMVFAVMLIVMGVLMLFDIFHWIPEVKKTIPTLNIIIGVLILVFAFLGFCGAIMEYNSLKMIYSIITLTLISLEMLLLFYTFFDENKLVKLSEDYLEMTWKAQQNGNTNWMDLIQKNLKCCGYNSKKDYHGKIPESCKQSIRPIIISTEGCKSAVKSYVIDNLSCFQYILLAVISLQVLLFTLGCFLAGNNSSRDLSFLGILH